MDKKEFHSGPPPTPEEDAADMAQREEAYQKFALLSAAYDHVIALEEDPARKAMLQTLQGQLHEDNA